MSVAACCCIFQNHSIQQNIQIHSTKQNGGSVNEVYATIALDALDSADSLTTLEEAQAAVDTLVEASSFYTARTADHPGVALAEATVVAQVVVEEVAAAAVAEVDMDGPPLEEAYGRTEQASAMDEAVARAAVALETEVDTVVEEAAGPQVKAAMEEADQEEEDVVEEEVDEQAVAAPEAGDGIAIAEAAVVQDITDATKAGGLQLPAALAKVGGTAN